MAHATIVQVNENFAHIYRVNELSFLEKKYCEFLFIEALIKDDPYERVA